MNRGIEPSVIRVQFGVDCGDHAETRRTAVEATRDTTVGELLDAHAKPRWSAWDLDDRQWRQVATTAVMDGETREQAEAQAWAHIGKQPPQIQPTQQYQIDTDQIGTTNETRTKNTRPSRFTSRTQRKDNLG